VGAGEGGEIGLLLHDSLGNAALGIKSPLSHLDFPENIEVMLDVLQRRIVRQLFDQLDGLCLGVAHEREPSSRWQRRKSRVGGRPTLNIKT
jgi:hypothetical protein